MVFAHGARDSFSVFYVPILDEFGWTRASTAGIFSVNAIAYGMTGPFAEALVDSFGPKGVLLIGGTIWSLAVILCSRANTIYYCYLLFGVVNGIGGSLIRSILQKNCNIVSSGDPIRTRTRSIGCSCGQAYRKFLRKESFGFVAELVSK